jgi:serpin B
MAAGAAPAEPVTLVVDRPFLFVIHDVEHGTPLFVGRVSDPRG